MRSELRFRLLIQSFLGRPLLTEVVSAVPLEALGQSQWLPVGRFVASALELLNVGEGLRHDGAVAVERFPVLR